MSLRISALFLSISLLIIGCNEDIEFKFNSPKKINIDKKLSFSVQELNGKEFDSIEFKLDGKKIATQNGIEINIQNEILGKHTLTAVVYYEGKSKSLHNAIYFLADKKPIIYDFKLINTFPHDAKAFTQGFEYHNGFLYESTGQKGQSSIRKTEITTGKVLQQQDLDAKYFGEGITIFNNKIHQLTWQGKIGFVYDLESFEQEGSFSYGKSVEGWGLTHNDKELIKSDGTERIWFLTPENHKEIHFIEAYTNKRKAEQLNEIEYINGKIYANIWQKNTIIIIDPKNGTIEGVANLNELSKLVDHSANNKDYVLNGIAYDQENNRLFVTGKNWNKTFEIELVAKK
ncbi:glutaminyl-peptide cyclotransferase [Flavicella sediminum]|uniref:glutaminyl-peptide cyclotransferase n=1 Tax=Flavicella sediminum TaxID=2585141 RepID=UPI00111E7933|nr:glutaminyl-peptide cyclotransferase [Flavicella sediminum]